MGPLSHVQRVIGGGMIAIILGLTVWLMVAQGNARHWEKKAEQFEGLYSEEKAAHQATVANYRAAAEKARRLDAENKARVEGEQRAITERTVKDYEARISDARERYARIVRSGGASAANPGGAGSAPVPDAGPAARGADGATAQGGLPAGLPVGDALICTEQALQLEALQQWAREQSKVPIGDGGG